jgi:hypothetical protein
MGTLDLAQNYLLEGPIDDGFIKSISLHFTTSKEPSDRRGYS